jgi:DNA repair photolyase
MACAYCYVGRRKGYANPISVFVNVDDVTRALARHAARLGPKIEPNTIDPVDWVYDLGENGDLSVDASLSDNVRDLVAAFRDIPNAKGSFATKYVNRDLLDYDPQGRTRIRFSLMPDTIAKVVDVRTSPMSERIAAINDFVAAGYEVHVNFSPVIVHENWEAEWKALFAELDAALSPAARVQLKCEVIFLTHNEGLHDLNL